MYVSLSASFKNSSSFYSTGANGIYANSVVPSTDVCIGLRAKMPNSLLTDAISTMADVIYCCRMTEVVIGKYVPFYYFSRGILRLLTPRLFLTSLHSITVGMFTALTLQFANQILAGSVSCLDDVFTEVVVSVGLRSAISVRILPPVRNVSRLTALTPLHRRGRTQRKRLPKKLPIPCPR